MIRRVCVIGLAVLACCWSNAHATSKQMWISDARLAALDTTSVQWDNIDVTGKDSTSWETLNWVNQDTGYHHTTKLFCAGLWYRKHLVDGTTDATTTAIRSAVARRVMAAARALDTAAEWNAGGLRTLAIGRHLTPVVLAADLIDLQNWNATDHAEFITWCDTIRTATIPNSNSNWQTLVQTAENSQHNWGAFALAAITACDIYIDDMQGYARRDSTLLSLTDRNYYPTDGLYNGCPSGSTCLYYKTLGGWNQSSKWVKQPIPYPDGINCNGTSSSWTETCPWTSINPDLGTAGFIRGIDVSGTMPGDAARDPGATPASFDVGYFPVGGPTATHAESTLTYNWAGVHYVGDCLSGWVLTAEMLYRKGYTNVWAQGDSALSRVLAWMERNRGTRAKSATPTQIGQWYFNGPTTSEWVAPIINKWYKYSWNYARRGPLSQYTSRSADTMRVAGAKTYFVETKDSQTPGTVRTERFGYTDWTHKYPLSAPANVDSLNDVQYTTRHNNSITLTWKHSAQYGTKGLVTDTTRYKIIVAAAGVEPVALIASLPLTDYSYFETAAVTADTASIFFEAVNPRITYSNGALTGVWFYVQNLNGSQSPVALIGNTRYYVFVYVKNEDDVWSGLANYNCTYASNTSLSCP